MREYNDRYEVHWDIVSPRVSLIGHLRNDSKFCWIIFSGGIAAMIGSFFGGLHTALGGLFGGMLFGFLTSLRRF